MICRHRRMTMATMLPRVKYIYSAYMLYIANEQLACIDFYFHWIYGGCDASERQSEPCTRWNIFYRWIYLNNILPIYAQHLGFKFTEIVKWAR